MLDRKKEIAQGMVKSHSGGSGFGALFQRQPADTSPSSENKNG